MLYAKINNTGAVATQEGEKPASMYLSRNSAAEFFMKIIEDGEYIRETISLSNRPE